MKFADYLSHYLQVPQVIYMFLVTTGIIILAHILLFLFSKVSGGRAVIRFELYYELVVACMSILFFTGLYFLFDYNYFDPHSTASRLWAKYSDFMLLGGLLLSLVGMTAIDTFIIPLKNINKQGRSIVRLLGSVYMMIVFAYIKFIYKNDNYHDIIMYFLLLVTGRYIYMDATFKDFLGSIAQLIKLTPILIVELIASALVAYYGFSTGYLLKSNGVVMSMSIAHMFFFVEVFIANIIVKIAMKAKK